MRLPVVMATVCVVLAGSAPGQRAAASGAVARPNVILVLADDVGYGDLSCHGNPVIKTPNLDKLHSESVRFTDFHVAPMCTPT
ncbi:MAG: sulfatase-like hydrolase/transferase, partial [Sedimentisphaerales bacterium]|nr:sulfatase-like hydrolase/transferase [Sedimentisphaerales bacterium]